MAMELHNAKYHQWEYWMLMDQTVPPEIVDITPREGEAGPVDPLIL